MGEGAAPAHERFSMPHLEVARRFGLTRTGLDYALNSGQIKLRSIKRGAATSPRRYDPAEVAAELARYEQRLAAQIDQDAESD